MPRKYHYVLVMSEGKVVGMRKVYARHTLRRRIADTYSSIVNDIMAWCNRRFGWFEYTWEDC